MCDDAIDYFDFSECLADLVRTEHLSLSEDGLYSITERGCATAASASQPGLFRPAAVRQESGQCNRKLRRKSRCGLPRKSGKTVRTR